MLFCRIFVSKYTYGYSKHSFPFSPPISSKRFLFSSPKRGDVIVFKTPADNRTDYIKRLIGMPGDEIQFIDGELYINSNQVLKTRKNIKDLKIFCGSKIIDAVAYEEKLPNGISYTAVYNKVGTYKNSDKYIIPEDFYSIADYAWAAGVVIKHAGLFKGNQIFEGVTIRHLVKEACRRSAADTEVAKFVRYFRLIKKLAKRDFRIDIFIDKFENMITEKPQVLALREFMPDTMTVGFQHYLAPHPLLLNMFTIPLFTKQCKCYDDIFWLEQT